MELEESSSAGSSLFQLIIALIMLGIGHSYSDDCNNGGTKYLVTGGWTIVAFNILPFILTIVKIFALADGVISRSENFVIKTLGCIQKCSPLISFVVTIWVRNGIWVFFCFGKHCAPIYHLLQGSTVVFSAYGTWTFDADDHEKTDDYCAKPAFECAFVLLLLQWVKFCCIHASPPNLECPDCFSHHGLLRVLHRGLHCRQVGLKCLRHLSRVVIHNKNKIVCFKLLNVWTFVWLERSG